jgi:hypothetical protein
MGITRTSGEVVLTAAGAVISSGKPVRIYSMTVVGSGTTKGELYSGTSKTGTARVSIPCVANQSVTVNFENGLLFSSGAYFSKESSAVSQATLECSLEL